MVIWPRLPLDTLVQMVHMDVERMGERFSAVWENGGWRKGGDDDEEEKEEKEEQKEEVEQVEMEEEKEEKKDWREMLR